MIKYMALYWIAFHSALSDAFTKKSTQADQAEIYQDADGTASKYGQRSEPLHDAVTKLFIH